MKRTAYVQVYRDHAGRWRWRRRAANNRVVGDSGQGYESATAATTAAERENPGLPVRMKVT